MSIPNLRSVTMGVVAALFMLFLAPQCAVLAKPKGKVGNKQTEELHKFIKDPSRPMKDKIETVEAISAEKIDGPGARGLAGIFDAIEELPGYGILANGIIDKLCAITSKDGLKELRDDVQDPDTKTRVRFAYFKAEAEAAKSDDDTAKFIVSLCDSDIGSVRKLAVEWIGEAAYQAGLEKAIERLGDDSWRVQSAALGALPRLHSSETEGKIVSAIIELMMKVEGRLVEDCMKALRAISGEDYGADPFAWRSWWNRRKGEKGGGEHGRTVTRAPRYVGIDSHSNQIIYVIDTSLSMRDPIDPDELKQAKRVITGRQDDAGGDKEPKKDEDTRRPINWDGIKCKLDLAREELKRTVEALDDKTRFTIVAYSTNVWTWKDTLLPATKTNKDDALSFISRLQITELTNIYGALDRAMSLAEAGFNDAGGKAKPKDKQGRASTGKREDCAADTIYFLTDGFATEGKYKGPDIAGRADEAQVKEYAAQMDAMLTEVRQRNSVAGITIHSIGVGKEHDRRTLKLLAEQNNGSYVAIGVGEKAK